MELGPGEGEGWGLGGGGVLLGYAVTRISRRGGAEWCSATAMLASHHHGRERSYSATGGDTRQCSEISASLRLSVYFAVVEVATNGQRKFWWLARVASGVALR